MSRPSRIQRKEASSEEEEEESEAEEESEDERPKQVSSGFDLL